jgi:hypothetical protein
MLSLARFIVGVFFIAVSASGTIVYAYEVTLAWDPNDEPDLAGYNVYVNQVGPGPPYYQLDTVSLDEIEPGAPLYTASELNPEKYYCFVVTAYDSEGNESGFSNEVCVLNGAQVNLSLTQERGGGGGCFINFSSEKFILPRP